MSTITDCSNILLAGDVYSGPSRRRKRPFHWGIGCDYQVIVTNGKLIGKFSLCRWSKYYFKNGCECFVTISKHEKTDAFIVFECLEIVMKHDARVLEMTSLMKQYKIMQCCSFSPFFFKLPSVCDLLYSVGIHCICVLLLLIVQ